MEDVRIYGNRLATATFPDHHLRRHCQVLVWDLAQAADPSVEEKTLWKREFFTQQSAEVGLAMDKTCLIHSEARFSFRLEYRDSRPDSWSHLFIG